DLAGPGAVEGHRQPEEGALPRAARADQGGGGAGGGVEGDLVEDGDALLVLEGDPVEDHLPPDLAERLPRAVLLVFGGHLAQLPDAVQPREGLADLGADRGDL